MLNVQERILAAAAAKLAAVPMPDLVRPDGSAIVDAAGHPPTVNVRRRTAVLSPNHLDGFLAKGAVEVDPARPTGVDQATMALSVAVYLMLGDDPTPVDTYANAAEAAVRLALLGGDAGYALGGLAVEVRYTGSMPFPFTDPSADGVTVMFNVLYRTALDDPYTLAAG